MDGPRLETCEATWLVPWWRGGRWHVGESTPDSSLREQMLSDPQEAVALIRRVGREVWTMCLASASVCLDGPDGSSLYATAFRHAGDRWHFYYLSGSGDVALRSVGDESAVGSRFVIREDFDEVPEAEIVGAAAGQSVVREWLASRRLSPEVRWLG